MASSSVDQRDLKKRLKRLMNKPENQTCVDCSEKQPRWASLVVPPPDLLAIVECRQGSSAGLDESGRSTQSASSMSLGAFCCLECSGSHRRLGTHLSFVRSVNLDTWKESEVLAMERGGNSLINAIYEAKLDEFVSEDDEKPTGQSNLQTRQRYIRDKYENRKYYDPNGIAMCENLSSRGSRSRRTNPLSQSLPTTTSSTIMHIRQKAEKAVAAAASVANDPCRGESDDHISNDDEEGDDDQQQQQRPVSPFKRLRQKAVSAANAFSQRLVEEENNLRPNHNRSFGSNSTRSSREGLFSSREFSLSREKNKKDPAATCTKEKGDGSGDVVEYDFDACDGTASESGSSDGCTGSSATAGNNILSIEQPQASQTTQQLPAAVATTSAAPTDEEREMHEILDAAKRQLQQQKKQAETTKKNKLPPVTGAKKGYGGGGSIASHLKGGGVGGGSGGTWALDSIADMSFAIGGTNYNDTIDPTSPYRRPTSPSSSAEDEDDVVNFEDPRQREDENKSSANGGSTQISKGDNDSYCNNGYVNSGRSSRSLKLSSDGDAGSLLPAMPNISSDPRPTSPLKSPTKTSSSPSSSLSSSYHSPTKSPSKSPSKSRRRASERQHKKDRPPIPTATTTEQQHRQGLKLSQSFNPGSFNHGSALSDLSEGGNRKVRTVKMTAADFLQHPHAARPPPPPHPSGPTMASSPSSLTSWNSPSKKVRVKIKKTADLSAMGAVKPEDFAQAFAKKSRTGATTADKVNEAMMKCSELKSKKPKKPLSSGGGEEDRQSHHRRSRRDDAEKGEEKRGRSRSLARKEERGHESREKGSSGKREDGERIRSKSVGQRSSKSRPGPNSSPRGMDKSGKERRSRSKSRGRSSRGGERTSGGGAEQPDKLIKPREGRCIADDLKRRHRSKSQGRPSSSSAKSDKERSSRRSRTSGGGHHDDDKPRRRRSKSQPKVPLASVAEVGLGTGAVIAPSGDRPPQRAVRKASLATGGYPVMSNTGIAAEDTCRKESRRRSKSLTRSSHKSMSSSSGSPSGHQRHHRGREGREGQPSVGKQASAVSLSSHIDDRWRGIPRRDVSGGTGNAVQGSLS